ncbi:MAG TPA: hypothetical protein PK347_02050 [Burkholderiaceae bacterium]|nr:hypothetical protein [Burkholderiaceae bacterium]
MQLDDAEIMRLSRLSRIAALELVHLQQTDGRLFGQLLSAHVLAEKCKDIGFSEQLDAFVARFGRLQDLLGDKFLPAWLKVMQEVPGTALENLDKAEKLGLVSNADDWFATRKLRNLMVHEYLQDPEALFDALIAAHRAVPMLAATCKALIQRTDRLMV